MPRLEPRATAAARVRSVSVSESFGAERQVEATFFGDAAPGSVTLETLQDGVSAGTQTYDLAGGEEQGGFDLQTGPYRGRNSLAAELGRFKNANTFFTAKPAFDAELGDAYPSGAISTPGSSTESRARDALTTAGYNLVVYDGPGIYRGEPEQDTGDVDTLSFLQSTLLATGARYWITEDTVYIDGRALPAGFALPSSDAHLITAYSWRDEFALDGYDPATEPEPTPTDEELELPPEPDAEDYKSQCPDYSGQPPGYEPPEVTPEDGDGTFTYTMTAGTGDDLTRVTRTNTYDTGRLVRAEATEEGVINTPNGKVFALKTKNVTTARYHPLCPQAMVQQLDQTFVAPELTDLSGETSPTQIEQAEDLYNALLGKTNGDGLYLQSERVETFDYHLEGWLQKSLEVNRELSVLSYRAPATPSDDLTLNLSYNTRTRSLLWEPLPNGQWVSYTLERQTENVVVYETSPGSGGQPDTSAPATVQRVSRTTPSVQGGDQAPPQMNCPEPDPKPDKGYFWDFGDGSTKQGGPNEVHTYENDGVYSVSVIFTDAVGATYDASGTAATEANRAAE